jgi:hypothetical protein
MALYPALEQVLGELPVSGKVQLPLGPAQVLELKVQDLWERPGPRLALDLGLELEVVRRQLEPE